MLADTCLCPRSNKNLPFDKEPSVERAIDKRIPCRMLSVILLILVSVSVPAMTWAAAEDTLFSTRPLRGVTVDAEGRPMDEKTVAAGLKDALHVAVENTVALRGARGGFGSRAGFHIAPAPDLCKMVASSASEPTQTQLLHLEERMNRIAEHASAASAPLLHEAVAQLKIPYAIEVLRGDNAAATNYLYTHKFAQIKKGFARLVRTKMDQAALYENVSRLLESLKHTGEARHMYDDIHAYVTGETLDGIFATLRHEEHVLRNNPAARPTTQTKRIFSR